MPRSVSRFLAALFALTLVLGNLSGALAATATPVASPVASGGHGIQLADMDLSVDPAQDFYQFANGGWLKRTDIPADRASVSTWDTLYDEATQTQLSLLDRESKSSDLKEGSDQWKVVQFFKQGTDRDTRNANGLTPLAGKIAAIDGITDVASLKRYLVEHALNGASSGFFSVSVFGDLADSSVNAAYLSGPVLGLPNRDYYLEDDASNQAARDVYTKSNVRFLVLLGEDEATATEHAQAVYDLEKTLASKSLTREQEQDYSLQYNPTNVSDLAGLSTAVDWSAYLKALGITATDTVIVTQLDYLKAVDAIIASTPISTIKDMLKLQFMWFAAPYLDAGTYDIYFDLNGRALSGMTTPFPFEFRVLNHINSVMGEALGQLYVAEVFPPEAKAQITELVNNILAAYKGRLEQNTWMQPETLAVAIDKLSKVGLKVGYPDKWRSYAAVEVGSTYVDSIINATIAEAKRVNATAGKPVDRSEWGMNPQEVNAYYDSQNNEIVFPAAILQPPFFDYQADPASNYGSIGYIIGHEITHGFDVEGSQFDAAGNLNGWWTDKDQQAFDALDQKLVAQYNAIEPLPGLNLDGQIELGENTADFGGIQNAYAALQMELTKNGDPGEIDGFTQNQRFFIAAAQTWREKVRDEALTTQVKSDPHAPGSVRAVQPSRNSDAFYEAFDIKEGDPMYLAPAERVVIW